MALRPIAVSALLNAAGAGAGLLGTTLIIWYFGLATFGIYTVALAKLAIVMLGAELLPSSYTQFRLQDDPRFAQAAPAFFLTFAIVAVAAGALMMRSGALAGGSWFILPYLFCAALQRGLDSQILARGEVSLSVSLPLVSNVVRAAMLGLFILVPVLSVPDALWASLFAGIFISQCVMVLRQPAMGRTLMADRPLQSLRYLVGLRREYGGYYVNSVLKRAKDTLFPLFCDTVLPNKYDLGKIFVYTRTSETVATQIRVLELFLINRESRAKLSANRANILLSSALIGHVAVVALSSFLLWRHGLSPGSVLYAAAMGLFMYPYVYELAKRSDAYAAHQPGRVTFSLFAYAAALVASLTAAWLLDIFVLPVLIGAIVLAQMCSALVYIVRDRQPRVSLARNSSRARQHRDDC